MLNINFDALINSGAKVLDTTPLWEKGELLTVLTVDGETVKLLSSKIGVFQLGVKTPEGKTIVLEIDKGSVNAAAIGHASWSVFSMKAARPFEGFVLTNGKLVSKDEFQELVKAGDISAVIDASRSDKGLVRIMEGQVKPVAFAS